MGRVTSNTSWRALQNPFMFFCLWVLPGSFFFDVLIIPQIPVGIWGRDSLSVLFFCNHSMVELLELDELTRLRCGFKRVRGISGR